MCPLTTQLLGKLEGLRLHHSANTFPHGSMKPPTVWARDYYREWGKSVIVLIKIWPRPWSLPQEQRVTSTGVCLGLCIIAPSDPAASPPSQHHLSHPAHLQPGVTLWNLHMETLLQQHWHTFCRITSSNSPFYRHSSLFAFAVYICSLTSIPGHNLTVCYWKHDTEEFVRVITMWSSPTQWSQ